MEDLDRPRVRPGAAEAQLADLRALGLDWDGPVERQSGRGELYRGAIERLQCSGVLYPCFCTRAEIREAASAPHGPAPEGRYPGTCRRLTGAERTRRVAAGRPAALRVDAAGVVVDWRDRLLGPQRSAVDDFVVRRNDGVAAYNLAVVVDDAAQGIDEVVRGADLADSTSRQVLLGRMLGLVEPSWAHVPLVLGADGARLTKRHGLITLADRAADGEPPARTLSLLAWTLGLAEPDEIVTPAVLLTRFDPQRLPHEPFRLEQDAWS